MKTNKIFFDLDHTLWDYNKNSFEVLTEIYHEFDLRDSFISPESFSKAFYFVNYQYWDRYNKGEIDRKYIRKNRFKEIIEPRKPSNDEYFAEISRYFLDQCPRRKALMPGALEVLDELSQKYRLGIITNGFDDVQYIKMESSGILHYFEVIVTSESADSRKPDRKIFDFALNKSRLKNKEVVMVGDNLQTDIDGASNAGWKSFWYNPAGKTEKKKNEIYHLTDLLDLL